MNYSQIKKHEEYKKLCVASYRPFEKNDIENYNLVAAVPGRNGFFACIYKKENEIVIVYRGTDDEKDWLNSNLPIVINKLPEQTQNALDVYEKFSNICKNNNWKLTVTGHSLGGSLAAIVGAKKGVDAVTFNAYGVKQLLNTNINYFSNNITNYCNAFDPITKMKAKYHIGKCYTTKSKDIFKNPHLLENMDSLYEREEAYGPYLQNQYEMNEQSKREIQELKIYGRRFGSYTNNPGCTGSYPVSGYTRSDGTQVDGYIRHCFKHG